MEIDNSSHQIFLYASIFYAVCIVSILVFVWKTARKYQEAKIELARSEKEKERTRKPLKRMSDRQICILKKMVHCTTQDQIASDLDLNRGIVETEIRNIKNILNVTALHQVGYKVGKMDLLED